MSSKVWLCAAAASVKAAIDVKNSFRISTPAMVLGNRKTAREVFRLAAKIRPASHYEGDFLFNSLVLVQENDSAIPNASPFGISAKIAPI